MKVFSFRLFFCVFSLFLAAEANADCESDFLSMACGPQTSLTCKDKYSKLTACKSQERLDRQAAAEAKRAAALQKKKAEVDAIEKINSANQKLRPHLNNSGKVNAGSATPAAMDSGKSF